MSVLGRLWASDRRANGRTDSSDEGRNETGNDAAVGTAVRRERRFGRVGWGPAEEVDVSPAPPPDARVNTGPLPIVGDDDGGLPAGAHRSRSSAAHAAEPREGGAHDTAPPPPPSEAPTPPRGFRVPPAAPRPAGPAASTIPPWRRPVVPAESPAFASKPGVPGRAADMSTRPGTDSADLDDGAPGRTDAGGGPAITSGNGSAPTTGPATDPGPAPSHGDTATAVPVGDTPASDVPASDVPATDTPASVAPADVPVATPAVATPAVEAPAAGRHAAGDGAGPVARERLAQGRMGIDDIRPEVSGGRFPSKAVVGEVVPVSATVWREGHDAVGATLVWQRCSQASHADVIQGVDPCGDEAPRSVRMISAGPETDRVLGRIVPDAEGLWSFRVEAWSDPWATWRHAVEVKVAAGQGPAELANDLESGARILDRGAARIEERFELGELDVEAPADADGAAARTGPIAAPPALELARRLTRAAVLLRDTDAGLAERLAVALSEPVHRTMTEQPVRELVTASRTHHVLVERDRALTGSWYEFFPRSTGGVDAAGRPVHGTFATAARELDRVAAMGFDVVYLPPIHPVGTVNRKGPNNTLSPGPDDVGSPWAIGSAAGGHDAVDPNLGTIEDFDAFVARAGELGLEVALDLALQCAPDHPWAAAHPEWFTVRPDGTIAYAENPPKKYQDIYPVNFDTDPDGIYHEVLRVVEYWRAHGVRIFRVDNPHTKPPDFWAWLIAEVHRLDPGVVFLAEAFTRPARLFGLAKAGFSQSYTYFTWRTGRDELREFFELHRDRIDEARPNCFVNTPDILHESLQVGGPGMFALRAALAATLSPSWGVYSGFELFEHEAVRPGSEEYLDSEKYELRPRDFAGALAAGRSLEPWITRLNQLRHAHPALGQIRTLRFHDVDNPALLAYSKTDPVSGDAVLCVVTLNPFAAEDGMLRLDMSALGLEPAERFAAFDEVSGQTFDWGQANYVRLEPWRDVAHIVSVRRR